MSNLFSSIITSATSRAIQDLVTSGAGILAAQGWFDNAGDQQKFIGSAFFLVMLVFNHFTHKTHTEVAANSGATTKGQ